MKTTKMVAVAVMSLALILGGCSAVDSNLRNLSTAIPMNGIATLATTMMAGGNVTSTPAGLAGDNLTGTPAGLAGDNLTGTPSAMAGDNGTGTPGANAGVIGTGTPDTMGSVATTATPPLSTTPDTTTPAVTPVTQATTDLSVTQTPVGTVDPSVTQTPVGTMEATTTPDTSGTPIVTATVDPMVTPDPSNSTTNPVVGGSTGTGQLLTLQASFEEIYNQVNPSVVYIEVVLGSASTNNTGPGSMRASGSGFVWDAQGHVVTNYHVVAGAKTVNVTFMDGTTTTATVVGQDPNADLAVLQVTASSSNLRPVTMGDSTKVRVGQIAIAIGNPFGLAGSMSEGIISALARSLPVDMNNQNGQNGQNGNNPMNGVYSIPNIIQTDAAINPGNSGGVLVNLQGEVIGVTAAIASQSQSNSGIGFVIPSEIVMKVVPELITSGKYAHPWMGITGVSMSSDVASNLNLPTTQRGALIIAVTPGSPAEAAALLPSVMNSSTGTVTTTGDIITAINGQAVRVFEDLGSYLFLHTKPGDVVTLTLLRNGQEQTVKVTLGTLPTP